MPTLIDKLNSALSDASNVLSEMKDDDSVSMRSHTYLHIVECDRAVDHAMQHVLAIEEHLRKEAAGE